MARRWNSEEEERYRTELYDLYVIQNMTIREIGTRLNLSEKTVFQRLGRLGIESRPERKSGYLHRRKNVHIPLVRSAKLAEFFGIMLGDGHVSPTQVQVTLGTKEAAYAEYVRVLIEDIFSTPAKIAVSGNGHQTVYVGSTEIVRWVLAEGLVSHKVRSQVAAPCWIFEKNEYMEAFLRGFFDTDGSVYKLQFGIQISLTNKSIPLLDSLQSMLCKLGYTPSSISAYRVYVTKRLEIARFFNEVRPANLKHVRRYNDIKASVSKWLKDDGCKPSSDSLS